MKILSVTLDNFRIHEHLTVEFDTGINLLIGRNGAGKSSILEAIGFALFNSELRVKGNKLAVRHGAKSAGIIVRFIGNDDNEYRVERKLGSVTRWQLFFGDEKSPRYQGSDELVPRLRELVGVKKNEKRLFSDVICAVQNRFVDIFAGTPVQRETTFNLLFDTEIYRDLYKHFTGDDSVERLYQYQQERLSGELTALEEIRIDTKAVKDEKSLFEEELTTSLEEQALQSEQFNMLKEKRSIVEKSQNALAALELERDHLSVELSSKNSYLQESEQQVVRATEAKSLIVEHEPAFRRYQELSAHRLTYEEKLKHESTVRQTVETTQNRISQIDLELERCESDSRSFVLTEENLQKQFEERTGEQQEMIAEIEKLQCRSEEIIARGKRVAEPMNMYKVELDRFKELDKEKELLLISCDQMRQQVASFALLPAEKERLLTQVQELVVKETGLKQFQEQKREREIELRELERAALELSDGICPLLKEQCNNLNGQTSSSDYFDRRKMELAVHIAELENCIYPLQAIPEEIREATRQQAVVEEKFRQLEQQEQLLAKGEEKLGHNQQLQSVILEKIALVEPDEQIHTFPAYEERHRTLEKLREQIGTEYKMVQERLVPQNEKLLAVSQGLQSIDQKRSDLALQKESILLKREALSKEKAILTVELATAKEQLKEYHLLRVNLEKVQQELLLHEHGYQTYLEKRELAATLEVTVQRVAELKSELVTLTERNTVVTEKCSSYDKEALQNELESILKQEKSLQEIIAGINERIVLKKEAINQCDKKLEQAKQQGDKISRLVTEQKRVSKKLELTALFRGNLKEMGRFVASGIVEDIAANATVHFHMITGCGERIEWLVNDSEKYTVYLVAGEEGEFRREFSVLSGGEQVAVALSLRAAMAQELASGDFAIFDEPTVNLDMERRIALAESLKSMLGTMEQTIIVTHDDVFREMAQKTIEL